LPTPQKHQSLGEGNEKGRLIPAFYKYIYTKTNGHSHIHTYTYALTLTSTSLRRPNGCHPPWRALRKRQSLERRNGREGSIPPSLYVYIQTDTRTHTHIHGWANLELNHVFAAQMGVSRSCQHFEYTRICVPEKGEEKRYSSGT